MWSGHKTIIVGPTSGRLASKTGKAESEFQNRRTRSRRAVMQIAPSLRVRRYPLETFASAPSGRPGTFWFRNSPNRGRRTHEHGLTRRRPIMFDDQTTEAAAPAAKDRCMWTAHPRQPAQTTSANATYYRHPPQVDPRSPQVDQPPRQPAQTTSANATYYHHTPQVDVRSPQVDPWLPQGGPRSTPTGPQAAPSRPQVVLGRPRRGPRPPLTDH